MIVELFAFVYFLSVLSDYYAILWFTFSAISKGKKLFVSMCFDFFFSLAVITFMWLLISSGFYFYNCDFYLSYFGFSFSFSFSFSSFSFYSLSFSSLLIFLTVFRHSIFLELKECVKGFYTNFYCTGASLEEYKSMIFCYFALGLLTDWLV